MNRRYANPNIDYLWGDCYRFEEMARLSLCWIAVQTGKENIDPIWVTPYHVMEIRRYEMNTKHETTAFLRWLEQFIASESAPFLHRDLTSSDLLDTVLFHQIRASVIYTQKCLVPLISEISKFCSQGVPIIARTHGQPAELMPAGHRMQIYRRELHELMMDLQILTDEFGVGKLRGPVGQLNKHTEELAALELYGVQPFHGSCSQVLPRTILARLTHTIALLGNVLSKMALDIRLMASRQEVMLDWRGHSSSSMPWKTNPAAEEKICGLARMLNAYVGVSLDNIGLWEERDMSHSSTERIYLEDMFHIICHMIETMTYSWQNIRFVDQSGTIIPPNNINQYLDAGLSRTEALEKAKSDCQIPNSLTTSGDAVASTEEKET